MLRVPLYLLYLFLVCALFLWHSHIGMASAF
jgi:hypothetical protein